MYVTLFPCNECAKIIIQFRIKTIVYLWEQARKPKTSAAMKMFDAADLTYRY
jgi:dCMP deaminase